MPTIRAADQVRDVGGEGEAREPLPGQVGDEAGELDPGLRAEDVAVQRGGLVAGEHGEAGHAGVADENVGAATEHGDRQAELAGRETPWTSTPVVPARSRNSAGPPTP